MTLVIYNSVSVWMPKVKRKLELDAEFKTPISKYARSTCVTKDIYCSYTG